jgi:outer membrane protein assembly factor BamB
MLTLLISLMYAIVTSPNAPSAGAASYQDWAMFLQNLSRTAATVDPNLSVANAATLKVKWKYLTGGAIATSTSIVGTTAYVGSWDGYEYSLSTTNGALIWKTYLGQTTAPNCSPPTIGVTSSTTVVNGVLYVGGGGPYWYALNATTGAVLWSVYTGDNSPAGGHYNWSSPLIYNGAAYVGIASNCDSPLVQGQLLKIDLTLHQVVATYNFVPNGQVGGGVWTTPTLDATTNTVFVSTGTLNDYTQTESQAIVALDATSLAYKSSWQLPFEAAVMDSDWGTTPTLTTDAKGDKLLAVANKNGILYTFNRSNLAAGPIWQRQIAIGGDCPTCGDGTISSGIFVNNVLYYAGGQNIGANGRGSGGSITAVDPGTGNVLWVRHTEQPIYGSPAYVNGMIADVEGSTFEVLDASNGTLLFSSQLGAVAYGAVSVGRSQFYVGALDDNLYAFGLNSSTTTPPPDPNCRASLTCQDIKTGVAGSESTTNGLLTVTASGAAIHGTSDQFRFISKLVKGDSQTSVQILSQSTQNTQPQAGIMVRQSTDPASPFYAVLEYPNDLFESKNNPLPQLVIWYRSCFGCTAIELTKMYPASLPLSIMIQRTGNLFNTGESVDGVNYQLYPGTTADVEMPATTLQGIAVDSGATNNTGTASFNNVDIGGPVSTTLTPLPSTHLCPAGWTCQDVYNPSPLGDATVSGTSYTVYGTGTGIGGGAADSFHYVFQTASGNEGISGQVVTQTGAPPTAQEGLMMRANTSPTSPYYAILVNPGGPAVVSWRTFDGVVQRQTIKVSTALSPVYLQIDRYQDLTFNPPETFFEAQTSPDGNTWTPVPGSTIAINMGAGSYLAGMAATAASPRVTPPVVINNPAITTVTSPPPGICPSGYTCSDIGTEGLTGNQVYLAGTGGSSPTWTVSARGSDIWSVYDSFRFMYDNFPTNPADSSNGDGTISARVVSQGNNPAEWMKSGVMIRSGADPQAPYYGVFVTPENGVAVQWRSTQAGTTTQVLSGSPVTTPIWVLASRYTDPVHNAVYYSAFMSNDGVNFTYIAGSEVLLSLPGPLVAGIASDTYNATQLTTVTFDNVAQLPSSQPPPYICPGSWSCADIGGALPPGDDQLTSSGTWNEIGGGGDIWTTADAFHFVWQTLSGDGTVTAHVTTQQATDPFAKAGPMLRATTDPGSPYYAAFITPGKGIAIQWRSVQSGFTSQVLDPGTAPVYLMVVRYTSGGQTYYSALSSPDGSSWSLVPGSTQVLTMPQPLLAGFGITSHDQGVGSVVTLDTVAVHQTEFDPPGVCPAPWSCQDIGGAEPPAQDTLSAKGAWTEVAGGGDIWDPADSFHLVSQTLTGDGTVSAHVANQQATSPWAKAGPMLRATNDPASPYYAALVTPGNGIAVQWRAVQSGSTQQLLVPGTVPMYLMVGRYTTNGLTYYSAYTSPDGSNWTVIPGSTQILNVPQTELAGFAITSHVQGTAGSVALDTVAITPGEYPPPGLSCPPGWNCADIGGATPIGGQTLSNGTWSIQGGGPDIWGTSDAFHFVWQSLPGDGSVVAQVVSQTASDPYAKAGVMIRGSSDPGAPFYAAYLTATGLAVQFRTDQGVNAMQATTSSGTAPQYLEVTRAGTTFTASTSPDGVNWTPVAQSTVSIPSLGGAVLGGLAVTSHSSTQLSTTVFDAAVIG